jgi:hypothetical protein
MKKDKLTFPFIAVTICFVLYMAAFHHMRDKNRELEKEIEILKAKIEILERK